MILLGIESITLDVERVHESGTGLALDTGVPVSKMEESINAHNQASLKTGQNPDGRPFPANPTGKSWDDASGKTGSRKKFRPASPRKLISQHSPPMSQPSPSHPTLHGESGN